MATVNVTNWAEFVEAIAVSGDTVNCPENAEWDANDFAPNGITEDIVWKCATVEGNGTVIRNLKLTGKVKSEDNSIHYIKNLHLLDFIADGNPEHYCFFDGTYLMRVCKLSGILSNHYFYLVYNSDVSGVFVMDKCSVNLEFSCNSMIMLYQQPCDGFRYCRMQIKGANSSNVPYLGDVYYSEVILYVPNAADRFYSKYFKGCTIRGNLQGILTSDGSSGQWEGASSVYCTENFPPTWTTDLGSWFLGVTDAQLRNPEYLRDIGFPIAVNSGGE